MSSRRRGRTSERGEIAPVVFAVDRVSFVRSCIGGVDLGSLVAREERCQRLIDELGIGGSSVESASIVEEGAVNRRADPGACHATIVPRSRHVGTISARRARKRLTKQAGWHGRAGPDQSEMP